MMNHGLKQSSRLIIDCPELTDRFMLRSIQNRINIGIHIDEVWLRERSGLIRLLYKKTTADQWPAPADNESVVISYGIVNAKLQTIPQTQKFMAKKGLFVRWRTQKMPPAC